MSTLTDHRSSYENLLRNPGLAPGTRQSQVDGDPEPEPSDELDCDAMAAYIVENAGDIASDLDTDDDAKLLKAARKIRDGMREAGAQ